MSNMFTAAYDIFALVVLIISLLFFLKLRYVSRLFTAKTSALDRQNIQALPSVSVCIPARNEMHAMAQCLERVIASDYPKLEIIVLDDESNDTTSFLIKSFAHAGVRFVEGSTLPAGWLGKNHALEGLLEEASGSYVLYLDVDTLIEKETISRLINYTLQEKAEMVSVLPMRPALWRANILLADLRYFWTLLLHRKSRPAAASSAWLVKRTALKETLNGFSSYRLEVSLETQLAAIFTKLHSYRFIVSDRMLGISAEKRYSSLMETSIRLLYPISGGRAISGILTIIFIFVIALPLPLFCMLVFAQHFSFSFWIMAIAIAMFSSTFALYLRHVWPSGWLLGFIIWPYIIIQELILYSLSLYRYATHTVTWKGRAVVTAKSGDSPTQ